MAAGKAVSLGRGIEGDDDGGGDDEEEQEEHDLRRGPQSRSGFLDDIIKVLKPERRTARAAAAGARVGGGDAPVLLDRTTIPGVLPGETKNASTSVSTLGSRVEDRRVETSVLVPLPRRSLKRSLSMNDALTRPVLLLPPRTSRRWSSDLL